MIHATTLEIQKVNIPEGQSGDWRVEKFSLNKEQADNFNIGMLRYWERRIVSGDYTRLCLGPILVMSDTPAEMRDHRPALRFAMGSVLINGLGLGMITNAVLALDRVTDVTVIEQSEDVIALVAPHIKNDRLTIIHDSAFEYKPPAGKRYGAVWHDIWDTISSANLPEMHKLHRKYGRRCDWQGSWCRAECEQML